MDDSTHLVDDNNRQTASGHNDEVHFSTPNILHDNPSSSPVDSGQNPNEGVTRALLLAVFTAICGTAFHFGYASGILNSPQANIEAFINETNHRRNNNTKISDSTVTFIFSLAVSIFALGGMIGGLFGGLVTDRLGRKGGMLANNIVSITASLLMFLSKPTHSYELLLIGRFFIGLACGYGSSVAPMYINEVSPKNVRGTFGASFQLGIVIFVFFAQVISLNNILGSPTTWHYSLALPIVFSIMQIILFFIVPESPKYLLLKKNDEAGAEKALRWFRGHPNVHHEVTEMQEEKNQQQKAATIGDLFRTPIVRWALFIAVVLQLSQQFSGINAVFYYSSVIFKKAGYSSTTAEYINLGTGAANVIVTTLSVFLMDRAGRRILHMTGLGGMCLTVTILFISLLQSTHAWNIISVIMTVSFVAFFGVGPGSIPWLITAELFNQAYRVPASSIAVLANWSANFVVALGFKPLFVNATKIYTFLIFTVLLTVFFLFTFFLVPETKAKSVDTIYAEINAGQVWRKRRVQLLRSENQGGQINNYGSTVDYGALPS
jgi:SP family facilitated glucose transporter-like MFS transporter 1